MPEDNAFTTPLDTQDDALDTIGGKGRSLSRLARAGFDVPGGFHVTTAAYRGFVAAHGLQERITRLARPELKNGAASFERASQDIQALFAAHPIGEDAAQAIRASYAALPDAPAAAVRKCWASLWTADTYVVDRGTFAAKETTLAFASGSAASTTTFARRSRSTSATRTVPLPTPSTAGMPYSRATMEAHQARPNAHHRRRRGHCGDPRGRERRKRVNWQGSAAPP